MIFMQFVSVAGCVRGFMMAQKCTLRISYICPKLHDSSARTTNMIRLHCFSFEVIVKDIRQF